MEAFEYARPTTNEEVVKLLTGAKGGAQVLAGGTDILSLMKDGVARPARLVSLQHVKELRGITFHPGTGLRLGATATFEELLENPDVRKHYPALAQAAEGVSSPQVRNTGTVAGDLCQRPRCWYYRAGFGLLAIYNGKPLVPDGDNRYHAILGNSGPAYFVSPSSLAPILVALNAKVKLHGPQGARELPVQDFFLTPKNDQEIEHALQPGEIVTEILVPAPGDVKMAVYEVRQKEALDWPLAAAAVVLNLEGDTVKKVRVVLGHVAPVPWPSPEAEEALTGKSVSEDAAWEAGKAALSKATPLSKNVYKVQLARVAVKRAILRAAKGEA
ncbi:MAG: xanthine dehydrogenase family protein subunit M [Acidobacteriia bacterium]|nr:xanthine dehydrogenase family protein subunit M [Terriglobia bacterium]